VKKRWPTFLLQWEIAGSDAARLLARYRTELVAHLNDDIQGTAAVADHNRISSNQCTVRAHSIRKFVCAAFEAHDPAFHEFTGAVIQDKVVPPANARKRFLPIDRDCLIPDKTNACVREQCSTSHEEELKGWRPPERRDHAIVMWVSNAKPSV